MPDSTFLILGQFERQGLGALVSGDRQEQLSPDVFKNLAADRDIKVKFGQVWFTTGAYDFVVEFDAPNPGRALAYAVALAAILRARTTTLAADANLADVLRRARGGHTRHGRPTGG